MASLAGAGAGRNGNSLKRLVGGRSTTLAADTPFDHACHGDLDESVSSPSSLSAASAAAGMQSRRRLLRQPSGSRVVDERRAMTGGGGAVSSTHRLRNTSAQHAEREVEDSRRSRIRGGRDKATGCGIVADGGPSRETRAAAVVRGQLRSELARAAQLCAECGFDEATGRLVVRSSADATTPSRPSADAEELGEQVRPEKASGPSSPQHEDVSTASVASAVGCDMLTSVTDDCDDAVSVSSCGDRSNAELRVECRRVESTPERESNEVRSCSSSHSPAVASRPSEVPEVTPSTGGVEGCGRCSHGPPDDSQPRSTDAACHDLGPEVHVPVYLSDELHRPPEVVSAWIDSATCESLQATAAVSRSETANEFDLELAVSEPAFASPEVTPSPKRELDTKGEGDAAPANSSFAQTGTSSPTGEVMIGIEREEHQAQALTSACSPERSDAVAEQDPPEVLRPPPLSARRTGDSMPPAPAGVTPAPTPAPLESPRSRRRSNRSPSAGTPKRRAAAKQRGSSQRCLVPPLDVASLASHNRDDDDGAADMLPLSARASQRRTPGRGSSRLHSARSSGRMPPPPAAMNRTERSHHDSAARNRAGMLGVELIEQEREQASAMPRRPSQHRRCLPSHSWPGLMEQPFSILAVGENHLVAGYAAPQVPPAVPSSASGSSGTTRKMAGLAATAPLRWQLWPHTLPTDGAADGRSLVLRGVHLEPVVALAFCNGKDCGPAHQWLVSCSVDRGVAWRLDELWKMSEMEAESQKWPPEEHSEGVAVEQNFNASDAASSPALESRQRVLSGWSRASAMLFSGEATTVNGEACLTAPRVAMRLVTHGKEAEPMLCVTILRRAEAAIFRVSPKLQSTRVARVSFEVPPRHLAIARHLQLASVDGCSLDAPLLSMWAAGGEDQMLWAYEVNVCTSDERDLVVSAAVWPSDAVVRLTAHQLMPSIVVHCVAGSAVAATRCYVGGTWAIVQIFDTSRSCGAGSVGKLHVAGESAPVIAVCAVARGSDEMLVALLADGGIFTQDVLSVAGEPVVDGSATRILSAGMPSPPTGTRLLNALAIGNNEEVFVAWVADDSQNGSANVCLASASFHSATPARIEAGTTEDKKSPPAPKASGITRHASRGATSFASAGARRGYGDRSAAASNARGSSARDKASGVWSPRRGLSQTPRSPSKLLGVGSSRQRVADPQVQRMGSDIHGDLCTRDEYSDPAHSAACVDSCIALSPRPKLMAAHADSAAEGSVRMRASSPRVWEESSLYLQEACTVDAGGLPGDRRPIASTTPRGSVSALLVSPSAGIFVASPRGLSSLSAPTAQHGGVSVPTPSSFVHMAPPSGGRSSVGVEAPLRARGGTPGRPSTCREQEVSVQRVRPSMDGRRPAQLDATCAAGLRTAVSHAALKTHPSHVVLTAGADAAGGLPDNWRRAASAGSSPPRSQPATQVSDQRSPCLVTVTSISGLSPVTSAPAAQSIGMPVGGGRIVPPSCSFAAPYAPPSKSSLTSMMSPAAATSSAVVAGGAQAGYPAPTFRMVARGDLSLASPEPAHRSVHSSTSAAGGTCNPSPAATPSAPSGATTPSVAPAPRVQPRSMGHVSRVMLP